jgi:hypothetical protein
MEITSFSSNILNYEKTNLERGYVEMDDSISHTKNDMRI